MSLALICHSIPLPCLLLQAALVMPHHHIIQTPPLLLRLVTLRTFPYSDITTIPCILHVIEDNATSPLVHYPISASRTWILSFRHQLSYPVFMCKTHQRLPDHFIENSIQPTFTLASQHTLPTSCIYLQLAVTFSSHCYQHFYHLYIDRRLLHIHNIASSVGSTPSVLTRSKANLPHPNSKASGESQHGEKDDDNDDGQINDY